MTTEARRQDKSPFSGNGVPKGPLSGMKVVDLSHIMAGPVCAMMLADMGAEVVKVERAGSGDDSRRMIPPEIDGVSAAFLMMNRNKKGVALDLKSASGKEALKHIIANADVVIENFRSGTMEKLGFDYATLSKSNPGLVYCAISGFGKTGPFSALGGFDLIAQGFSGLMSITGESADRDPVKIGSPVTDICAGVLAAMAICAAYASKLQTGRGQEIDASLFEAGIMLTYWQSAAALATGKNPEPLGSGHPLAAPYQAYRTADGWITVGAANQANWERLNSVLGITGLVEDPRFKTNAGRMLNLVELNAVLSERFSQRSSAEWLADLRKADVPSGPILSILDMLSHPQTKARNMVIEVDHPRGGKTMALGLPVKFSSMSGAPLGGAPLVGQNTQEVLEQYNVPEAIITEVVNNLNRI